MAIVENGGKTVEQTIPLEPVLQETYIKTIKSAQLDIVEPYMRRIAARDDVQEVRFEAIGTFPSGKKMKPLRWSLKPGEPMKQLRETP